MRSGMRIDVYDHVGVQRPEEDRAFEADWTPAGVGCIAHAGVPENGSLVAIAAAHPRLAGRTGPEACTEESATAVGALIFNRARDASATATRHAGRLRRSALQENRGRPAVPAHPHGFRPRTPWPVP
jgi:hypothetical protein